MNKFLNRGLVLAGVVSMSMGLFGGPKADAYGERQVDQFLTDSSKDYINLSGKDRQETSRLISQMTYDHTDEVIIVDGSNYVDSMSAIQVSAYLDAPILLNGKAGLDKGTRAEMIRLRAEHA